MKMPGTVDESTREQGGNEVNDESVWVCVIVFEVTLYNER